MKSFPKIRAIVAAAGAVAAIGAAAPAHAFVYAMSHLKIDQLVLAPGANTTLSPISYTFTTSNSADINGATATTGNVSCTNLVAPGCSASSPVLDAAAVNAPGSSIIRANNDFSIFGSGGGGSYSSADSVINTAQLVQGVPTSIEQISESLLNTNGIANANTLITSNTIIRSTVSVSNGGNISLGFLADVDMSSSVNEPNGLFSSQGDVVATFQLTGNGGSLTWAPDGTVGGAGACTLSGSFIGTVTCSEVFDGANLNRSVSTPNNPGTDNHSFDLGDVFAQFGLNVSGLSGGNYTIALQAKTSTTIVRVVPEPATTGLIGVALAGMGLVAMRRRKNKQA